MNSQSSPLPLLSRTRMDRRPNNSHAADGASRPQLVLGVDTD